MSSVNHYSRDVNHTNTLWWQHDHHHRENDAVPPLPAPETVWSKNDSSSCSDHQLETLFEKSLTPSDVGKLNRLVIPKQHAEKYFPLNGSSSAVLVGGSGGDAAEKGMLLSFEDETGKCWMFRYSYWNSSQSYVLTKGWSRYVREKQLDAGDVVFFQRHRSDARRLSIGWRRRGGGGDGGFVNTTPFSSGVATSTTPYLQLHHQIHGSTYPYYEDAAATVAEAQLPATTAMGPNSRTVRLFGVNLECQLDDDDDVAEAPEPPCHDGYGLGSSTHFYYYPHPMNISFSGDTMKHMRDRRG